MVIRVTVGEAWEEMELRMVVQRQHRDINGQCEKAMGVYDKRELYIH